MRSSAKAWLAHKHSHAAPRDGVSKGGTHNLEVRYLGWSKLVFGARPRSQDFRFIVGKPHRLDDAGLIESTSAASLPAPAVGAY